MNQTTPQIRLEQWAVIIQQCLNSGLSKIEWCRRNNISAKTFFYWQRRVRAASSNPQSTELVPVFAQLPVPEQTYQSTEIRSASTTGMVTLRTSGFTVEIPNTVLDEFLLRIMKAVTNV